MPRNSKKRADKALNFVSRQKWDANLEAEDSLVALDFMERLGFRTRADFIRHALTNPVLLEQQFAFEAIGQVASLMTELRADLSNSGVDAQSLKRIEQRLRDIYAIMQLGVAPCPDRS